MSRIRASNTKPEVALRSMLHRMGYRFRLHRRDLPGTPDIVLPKWKTVIFVNGCFWHGHVCKRGKMPKTRSDFWAGKVDANRRRDRRNLRRIRSLGWHALVVWECELKKPARLAERLKAKIDRTGEEAA